MKWWKFVPQELQDEICPEPPDSILIKVKKEEKQRLKFRQGLKIEANGQSVKEGTKDTANFASI